MRGMRSSWFVLPLLAAAAACSGGDAAPASTTSPIVPTVARTEPVATMAPTTTTAPATTTPTAAPSTTAPPAPTSAPPTVAPGSVEEQVIAAALESWRLLNEARLDPFNDEKVAAAGQAHIGTARDGVVQTIADYRFNNQKSVTNPDVPSQVIPYPGTVIVDAAGGFASVEYCQIDTNSVVAIGANPDGSDQVLNDEVAAYRIRIDLELVDGRWLEAGGELLQTWDGVTACPDQP